MTAIHHQPRHHLLGVNVNAITREQIISAVATAIRARSKTIIANHNLHSVALHMQDEKMQRFFERAHLVHIDGMPLVWWGRLMGHDLRAAHRTTYVDLMPALLDGCHQFGWRLYLVGAKPGVVDIACARVSAQFPGIAVGGWHGYFDRNPSSPENRAVLRKISEFRPDILLVGMGMPQQEEWIYDNLDGIHANAILTGGAAIDYTAGVVAAPPRWTGVIGLEWAARLANEPARLWRRYLVEPITLFPLVCHDLRLRVARLMEQADPT